MPGIRHSLKSQSALMQLFYEAGATHKPKLIAAELEIPYNTLMRYVQGPTPCPAEILAQLYALTKFDPIRQVLTPEGHQIVPLGPAMPDKETLEEEILDDICHAARLCETYRASMADGHLSEAEHSCLLGIMNDLRNECEETLRKLMEIKPVKVRLVKRVAA